MAKQSRQTKQKGLIYDEITKIKTFFSAEDLHNRLHKNKKNENNNNKKNTSLGIATIYRSLNRFVKEGRLCSYVCNRRMLYSQHNRNHCHFICENCNKNVYFEIKSIDFLKNKIDGKICHFQVDLSGLCSDCLKKNQ